MTDAILIAIVVAFFALAIALVRVLGWIIDRDTRADALADEPPDTGAGPRPGLGGRSVRPVRPVRPR